MPYNNNNKLKGLRRRVIRAKGISGPRVGEKCLTKMMKVNGQKQKNKKRPAKKPVNPPKGQVDKGDEGKSNVAAPEKNLPKCSKSPKNGTPVKSEAAITSTEPKKDP